MATLEFWCPKISSQKFLCFMFYDSMHDTIWVHFHNKVYINTFFSMNVQLFQHYLLNDYTSPSNCFCTIVKISWICLCASNTGFPILWSYVSVLSMIPENLGEYSYIVSFNILYYAVLFNLVNILIAELRDIEVSWCSYEFVYFSS